ncbi:hypothetical protein Ae168Ps1_6097c [Pseudonocardia sp. Ae168_Ps1]|nr:Antifreeze glycopeptide AFGP polyprotein precursor [Pseudonocardia sp. Ae150A_Ps1]OLL70632.1 hypothetical protein Ae168Ps1_6097c [Pseudonocardia sp. Ae168_Ps1]OLL70773.1 hypothetical protein Ae263Ps1_6187c [Pseudonocardia sp. Ae263_Ps1]OLL89334.1 Antifreeze glycopeptide AFGP polyprotein precursor [Pseudonocardia sp. Ae356_Ps1]
MARLVPGWVDRDADRSPVGVDPAAAWFCVGLVAGVGPMNGSRPNGSRSNGSRPQGWAEGLIPTAAPGADPGAGPDGSDVAAPRLIGEARLLAREVAQARAVVALQDDPALVQARSARERRADRRVAEKLRGAERAEARRVRMGEIAAARGERREAGWAGRAVANRDRLLNPDRRLTSTYRRYVGLSMVPPALIAAGVLFMAVTVHDGVVGVDGPWYGYLIEPLASVLLVVSLFVGFTAVQHGRRIPRGLYALDAGLAGASLALTVVPWGVRYGFDPGSTLAHVLPPLLVAAAVVVQHVLHSVFRPIFADLYDELTPTRLDEASADTVVLYERTRRAVADGLIPAPGVSGERAGSVSREAIRKTFGVGKSRAQLAGDAYDHVTAFLHRTAASPAATAFGSPTASGRAAAGRVNGVRVAALA